MYSHTLKIIGAAIAATCLTATAAMADGMPKKSTWTAYGTTSSGYAQAVAIGNMLKQHFGAAVRVIPGKDDIAFAGVTWDDVEKVTVSGFNQSFEAIINGQADAAFSSTVSPVTKRLAASPRGLHWPPLPHDDAEGWKRTQATAPYYVKNVGTLGTNMSKDTPHIGAAYPYPILVANASKSDDKVYTLTKAMVEHYDDYKDGAKGALGWHIDKQQMQWAMPYHDGAIRFWKEKGKDKDAFMAGWAAARTAALNGAGMDPVFK